MKSRKSRSRRPNTKPAKVKNKKEPSKSPPVNKTPSAKGPDFVERFLKFIEETPFKLPRGKSGRPDLSQRRWQEECFNLNYLALASYYGGCPSESDYELCIAWALANSRARGCEEATTSILDKLRGAIDQQDESFLRQLLHACTAHKEKRPKFPLEFALVKARLVLKRKGQERPSRAHLVTEAMSYFHEQPKEAKQVDSLQSSLFRKVREIYKALLW